MAIAKLNLPLAGGINYSGSDVDYLTLVDPVYAGQPTDVPFPYMGADNRPLRNLAFRDKRIADKVDEIIDWGGITDNVHQVAHGFVVGDVIRFNGAIYVKAKADTAQNAEVAGVVNSVPGVDDFTYTIVGEITELAGLASGLVYFLSEATAGAMTTTEPAALTDVSKPVLVATSATTAIVLHLRGMIGTGGGHNWSATEGGGGGGADQIEIMDYREDDTLRPDSVTLWTAEKAVRFGNLSDSRAWFSFMKPGRWANSDILADIWFALSASPGAPDVVRIEFKYWIVNSGGVIVPATPTRTIVEDMAVGGYAGNTLYLRVSPTFKLWGADLPPASDCRVVCSYQRDVGVGNNFGAGFDLVSTIFHP